MSWSLDLKLGLCNSKTINVFKALCHEVGFGGWDSEMEEKLSLFAQHSQLSEVPF